MAVKFADDIVKEIKERGSIEVPEGYVAGEAFEEWLYKETNCKQLKDQLDKNMRLERKPYYNNEYFSELTKELDVLAKFNKDSLLKHYILADDYCKKEKCLAIRVPGGTVGGIWFDQDNVITKIRIDTNYVVKTYPEHVEKIIQKYVGAKIEF